MATGVCRRLLRRSAGWGRSVLLLNRATPLKINNVGLVGGDSRVVASYTPGSADLPTADGGDTAFILHHGNDDIDAVVDWRRRVGGIVWRAPSGLLVSVLAILVTFVCARAIWRR